MPNCNRVTLFAVALVGALSLASDRAVSPSYAYGPQEPVSPKLQWAPSPVPDRIVLTWTGDPRTTQAVTWRTSPESDSTRCEYAVAGHGPKFTRKKKKVKGTSEVLETDLGPARYHTIELGSLTHACSPTWVGVPPAPD